MIFPLEAAPPQGEVGVLKQLKAEGFPLVPTVVVALEEEFLRLANLKEQIRILFQGAFGARIDEERLLYASERAEALVHQSYLLPERAEAFLAALRGWKGPFSVRDEGLPPFAYAPTPQESLFALKRLYASRYRVEAVLERWPELFPAPPSVLVQEAGKATLDPDLSARAQALLGQKVQVEAWEGKVVRVILE
ncbi:MAG: hypothetical protein ACUVQC_03605 [Thermaceae bacterium]